MCIRDRAWWRDAESLVGMWEPAPVSKQLDALLNRFPSKKGLDYGGAVEGALRRFVLLVMKPYSWFRLVSKTGGRNVDWISHLLEMLTSFRGTEGPLNTAVVLGRSVSLDRWIVIWSGSFPTTRRRFGSSIESVLHSSDTDVWCMVWGKSDTVGSRTVVSLFSCLLYTSPSPRDRTRSRMPSSA